MKKKLLTVALAAAMTVMSTVGAFAETLTGTAWWTGSQASKDYELAENGEVVLYAECLESDLGYGFVVESYVPTAEAGSKLYITASSNDDAWGAEGLTYTNTPAEGQKHLTTATGKAALEKGTVLKITVKRSGADISFEMYNMTANEVFRNYVFEGTNYTGAVSVHFTAQTAAFEVGTTAPTADAPSESSSTEAGSTEAGSTTAATTAAATTAAKDATAANTGDSTMVVALLAVAALSAVVVLKKKTVTE